MERDYQIIVWGATGFTGQIVTEYLHNNYGSEIRWAIAGRNLEKLQNVKQKLQLDANIECLVGFHLLIIIYLVYPELVFLGYFQIKVLILIPT